MTLVRSSRATRCRTLASEMPRSLAMVVYARRPSTCRWPMMAMSVLSSDCLRMAPLSTAPSYECRGQHASGLRFSRCGTIAGDPCATAQEEPREDRTQAVDRAAAHPRQGDDVGLLLAVTGAA